MIGILERAPVVTIRKLAVGRSNRLGRTIRFLEAPPNFRKIKNIFYDWNLRESTSSDYPEAGSRTFESSRAHH
jgi:hypothetical protein